MVNSFSQPSLPAVLLYVFVIVTQFANGIYMAAGVEASPALTGIAPFGFLWALTTWFEQDFRSRGLRWTVDTGFFLYVGWLLLLPYYLMKTRGWRGVMFVLLFPAVYFGSEIAGIVLYLMFQPVTP